MHLAQGPSRVEEDLNQIKDLISAGEIYAFKSLQDYGQAFGGRDGKNDATALMARLHEHRQQTRKYGSNENSRREFNEIIASALQLADKIHDEFVARLNPGGPNPPGASRTLVLVPPAGAPVETEGGRAIFGYT